MGKVRQIFVCRACAATQHRWMGKCPDCGAWDALEEQRLDPSLGSDPQRGTLDGWAEEGAEQSSLGAAPITEIKPDPSTQPRLHTGIGELDRVLGSGLIAGSVVLVGGDPGIGKSTLVLQAAGAMALADNRRPVLYVSSEESAEQVRMRAERLGVGSASGLYVLAETNLARIIEQARRVRPAVVMIDSVQMVYKADLDASPGSVAQLRRCCAELVYLAKLSGTAVVLVGHVTKDGQMAGPRLLEHLVDAVLYFEGDRYHGHRVLRAVKNRFGTTLEIGIFEMTGAGLREALAGPGAGLDLSGSGGAPKIGAAVCPIMTGSRCMLVEVQALSATGFLGAAKRKCSGLDANRLAMIIAVLEQHAELRLADRDIFASSVGGVRVVEPAADLALLLAIAGAHFRRPLAPRTAVVGEVGLGGEVRPVTQIEHRVGEARRLGFSRIIVPATAAGRALKREGGLAVDAVRTISEAIERLG